MVRPAKPWMLLPPHHNLIPSAPSFDARLASMKETMRHIRTLWIDFTFFCNPPLQNLILILLQSDQMDSIYCECLSKTIADNTLSSLHCPKLSSLSIIIRDACCIKFPDGFTHQHPQLRRLSLIHLEPNSEMVQVQHEPFPAHLPSLESVVLSSNYTRWFMDDASSLRDFLIIPSNHHPPADSDLYCKVMRSPCLLMGSSQPLLLPLNSALQIHWPSDVQKHAALRSGLQCLCTPNRQPLVQDLTSLEINLDYLDPSVFVSLMWPHALRILLTFLQVYALDWLAWFPNLTSLVLICDHVALTCRESDLRHLHSRCPSMQSFSYKAKLGSNAKWKFFPSECIWVQV